MVFEPKYEKVISSSRGKLGTTQAVIDVKLPSINGLKVNKVLCANAKSLVSDVDLNGNDVNFNGSVTMQVIYIDETGDINGLDYTAEFRDKYTNSEAVLGRPIIWSNVVDVKADVLDNEIKVNVIVEVDLDEILTDETKVLVGVDDNSVYVQKEMVKNTYFLDDVNEKFDVSADIEIKDSVLKVLSVCISPSIEKILENDNYFSIFGNLEVGISYLTDGENSKLRSHQFSMDFNHDVLVNGSTMESIIHALLNVVYPDVKITTSLDRDNAILNLIVPLNVVGYVFNKQEIEVVTDVFSTENYLNTSYENIRSLKGFDCVAFAEKINGGFSIDESQPFVDEVLGNCCNNVIVAMSKVEDGRLVVEGVAYTTVIYFNKEYNNTNSVEVEMPFSISSDIGDVDDSINVQTLISIGNVVAKCRRGKDIEIAANLNVYSTLYTNMEETVISSVEVSSEKEVDDLVLNIYIVKDGETIWDVAKNMNISPDLILEQNPDVELPIKAGDKLVIYKQKVVEF